MSCLSPRWQTPRLEVVTFDAESFDHESVEGSAIEYLRDNDYLGKSDSVLLSRGDVIGQAGATNVMKILPVR